MGRSLSLYILIRKLSKPKTYFHFIGTVKEKGIKLSFMPILGSKFTSKLNENLLIINKVIEKISVIS